MSNKLPNKKGREYYLNLRNHYCPDELKYIFILESPPCSGKYFYNESGEKSEPLFRAMMKLLDFIASNKKEGLTHFQNAGYLLVDATYQQINKLSRSERDKTIRHNFKLLIEYLKNINSDKEIPLILVKVNVCRILEPLLKEEGFNVLNNNVEVPFPVHNI